jgi:GT2 family glycosyltransferase
LQEGGLASVVSVLESDPGVGLVAPPVYRDDGVSRQPDVCGRFPTPLRLLTRSSTADCTSDRPDWLSGVALLVRREEFIEIGGFDENIFLYYEDIELCHRYRTIFEKGCRRVVDGPGVVHIGGASRQSRRGQKALYYAAQDYYLEKAGHSAAARLLVRAARVVYASLTVGRRPFPP